MRAFILITCLVASALARPEAAVGYNYSGLQRGLPQNVLQLQPHIHQQLPAEQNFANFGAPQASYLAPSPVPPQIPVENLQHVDAPVAPIDDVPPSSQPLPLANQDDSYNNAYHQSANSHETDGYPYVPQTTIHKHIYVHVPPKDFEDEDIITPRVHHQAAPKQKHYKIVFIKAPAAPSIRPPVVPPPPQNEEKTLIYVLHKKPDLEQEIVIPTAAPTTPSKPEVYFIKYKTKKEEAPVYGPPPQQQQPAFIEMQARNVEMPSAEYGAPSADSLTPEPSPETAAPLTTVQPVAQEQSQPQFPAEVPSDVYGAPTMPAVMAPEEAQPTMSALNNQYLAPEPTQTMAPIIVEDTHVPANKYGPPNRFFIKKK